MDLQIKPDGNGYTLQLSRRETDAWANRPGYVWPNSKLADHRLFVSVNRIGLEQIEIDNDPKSDCPAEELAAIIHDHTPRWSDARRFWPCWGDTNF